MRVEPFSVGSVVHVIKRGARGMEIVRDEADQWRFMKTLYILNDDFQNRDWTREAQNLSFFSRPDHWPERDPLAAVLAWTLMPNHFHLLLYEIHEGGVSKYLQRLCGSMTLSFNEKYGEKGSIFQGSYKSRTIHDDADLNYILAYVIVKNVFELYPGGFRKAVKEFDKAWEWAKTYPFSSFKTMAFGMDSPVTDSKILANLGLPGEDFKQAACDMLISHAEKKASMSEIFLEEW